MSPYEVLGIFADATPEQIKFAYRRCAAAHHPDRGGDVEQFKTVQWAFELLSDPERRRRYNETGETEPSRARNQEAEVAAVLQAALESVMSRRGDAEQYDLAAELKRSLEGAIGKAESKVAELSRQIAKTERIAERFERTTGPNLLADIVRAPLAQLRAELEEATATLDTVKAAWTVANTTTYRHDPGRGGRSTSPFTSTEMLERLDANRSSSGKW